jgi:hypothetical protein
MLVRDYIAGTEHAAHWWHVEQQQKKRRILWKKKKKKKSCHGGKGHTQTQFRDLRRKEIIRTCRRGRCTVFRVLTSNRPYWDVQGALPSPQLPKRLFAEQTADSHACEKEIAEVGSTLRSPPSSSTSRFASRIWDVFFFFSCRILTCKLPAI